MCGGLPRDLIKDYGEGIAGSLLYWLCFPDLVVGGSTSHLVVYNRDVQRLVDDAKKYARAEYRAVLPIVSYVRGWLMEGADVSHLEDEELRREAAKWEAVIGNIFSLPAFDVSKNMEVGSTHGSTA